MKRGEKYGRILSAVSRFLVIFAIVTFFISCCLMLFVTVMTEALDITLVSDDIEWAAKLTLVNVIALTVIFTVLDLVRIKFAVDRPTKRIIEAAEKMAAGDFSARIERNQQAVIKDNFSAISECFNKMAEELSGTETLRTDFIANVSHELKTPLAVIQNYAAMLKAPALSDESRLEYATAITESTSKLATLISNILKLNKLENQQMTPKSELFDLGEHVGECLIGFEDAWEAKDIVIETDIEDGITVCSDREMLSLVWNNLFSNAIKFTPNGGTVSLKIHADGDRATVMIGDTGCGISVDVGKHIFEKFYQGDTSHASEGNGLGLALVKRVVDITGSEISVESEPGVGTVFTVTVGIGISDE